MILRVKAPIKLTLKRCHNPIKKQFGASNSYELQQILVILLHRKYRLLDLKKKIYGVDK